MRERTPLLVLVAASCAFLASLYLPWQTGGNGTCGPGCVEPTFTLDAWSAGIGDVAALAGFALACAAAAAFVRPRWSRRVPLMRCGLAVAYLTLALGFAMRALLRLTSGHPPVHWAYGGYLGVASAVVALCVVALVRRPDLSHRPSASTLVFVLLGLGLLASFLLPWYRSRHNGHVLYSQPEILFPTAALAALAISFGGTGDRRRLGSAAAAALFTGAAFGSNTSVVTRAYGAWLGLAFALALIVFATFTARGALRRPALTGGTWAVAGATSVFVASLFMSWQTFCAPAGSLCVSANGWTLPNSTAAALALLVVAAPALRLPGVSNEELAIGTGLLVATAGFGQLVPSEFAYGTFVGFVAAGGFVLLTLGRHRPVSLDRRQLAVRFVPATASSLLLLAVLLPWWSVLPSSWQGESSVLAGWLAIAGLLLSLHLLASWLSLPGESTKRDGTLTLVPIVLLALTVLGIAWNRSLLGLTWGGGILIALCLLLALFGWVEERGGGLERLRRFRPPELLRIDRLPGAGT